MKIFDGFALDMAAEFSGLSKSEIGWLGKQKIVAPKRDYRGTHKFSFSELLMLRLVRLLKLNRVSVFNIRKARRYIKDIDPSRDLTNIQLYIRCDTGEILYIGEEPQKGVLVSMSKFGQLLQANLLTVLPIGKDLEHVKNEVLNLDTVLAARIKSRKLISLDDAFKKYGFG